MSELESIMDEFDDLTAPDIDIEAERVRYAEDDARDLWAPSTVEEFDWAARKLARIEAKRADMAEMKCDELAKLALLFDRRIRVMDADAEFFRAVIQEGVRALEPDGKGKRTIRTPHMTAYERTTTNIVLPADGSDLAWAKSAHPEFVRASLDVAAVKKYIKETGDAPEGTELIPSTTVVIKGA